MGICEDIKDALKKFEITKIEGQPTDEDLSLLRKELSNAAGSIATQNGGGEHGHVGLVLEDAEYRLISNGNAAYVIPTNPGAYPATVDPNDAAVRERQVAEHKAEIVEYETHHGVQNFLRQAIVKAVDPEWLVAIEDENLGFNHLTPLQMLTHLRGVGGTLDEMDVTELTMNLQKEWDGIETPASHFARGDKFERQLLKVGQNRNPELRLAFGVATFKKSGQFENALREWDATPATNKTFANFRVFMQKEYGKCHKQNKSTASSVGHGIANTLTEKEVDQFTHLEAQAMIFAEVANSINEKSAQQFKEMMELFKKELGSKGNVPNPPNPTPNPNAKKKKLCPHCNMEVYHKPEKCFELEANAEKRPAGWKSKKST